MAYMSPLARHFQENVHRQGESIMALMRGINLGSQNNTVYSRTDVQQLAFFGINTIRIFIDVDYSSVWDKANFRVGNNNFDEDTDAIPPAFGLARVSDLEPYTNQVLKAVSIMDEAEKFNIKCIVRLKQMCWSR